VIDLFLELLGFEIEKKTHTKEIWEIILKKDNFKPISFHNFEILINQKEIFNLSNGYIIKYDYKKYNESKSFIKTFSLIIHKDLKYLFLETEGDSSFKYQIINIFNENFNEHLKFYALNFYIDQGWAFLNKYREITYLQIITERNGVIEIEDDFKGKENYPIYSSILKVQVENNTFSVQFNINGFNFPPRMKDIEIFDFLEQTKQILI